MPGIASLEEISDALDTGAKFIRLLANEGVTGEQLRLPIDNKPARQHLAAYLKAGCPVFELPVQPEQPKPEPAVIDLGEFTANYGETIAAKLAAITDPACIGWRDPNWANDEKFPDARTGMKHFKASAVRFRQSTAQDAVETWCRDNKKILATPKEGIDLAKVSPRPNLDNVMPLAMAGQFFVGAFRDRDALCFGRGGDERDLDYVWLNPDEQWDDNWWFLVLEELPSAA